MADGDPNDPYANFKPVGDDSTNMIPTPTPTPAAAAAAAPDPYANFKPLGGNSTDTVPPPTPTPPQPSYVDPTTNFPVPDPATNDTPYSELPGKFVHNFLPDVGRVLEGGYRSGKALWNDPTGTLSNMGKGIESMAQAPIDWAGEKMLGPTDPAQVQQMKDLYTQNLGPDAANAAFKDYQPRTDASVDKEMAPWYGAGDVIAHPLTHITNAPVSTYMNAASVVDPMMRGALGAWKASKLLDADKLLDHPGFANTLSQIDPQLQPSDFTQPQRQAIANTINQKGMSPSSVKEGIVTAATGDKAVPRSSVTGVTPKPEAQQVTSDAVNRGRATVASNLSQLAGPGASEADLGAALQQAHAGSKYGTDAAYKDVYASDPNGVVHPSMAQSIYNSALAPLKADPVFPQSYDALAQSRQLSTVQSAIDSLHSHLNSGAPMTVPWLENVRRDIGSVPVGTSSTEGRYIGSLTNGFDSGVSDAMQTPGMFSGSPLTAQSMEDARTGYANHMNLFDDSPSPDVRGAVTTLKESTPGEGAFHQAGSTLARGLMNNARGPLLYDRLGFANVGPKVDQYVRNQLLSGSTKDVAAGLDHPVASRVFTPDEISQARVQNTARGILESPTQSQAPSKFMKVAKPLVQNAARIAAPFISGGHGVLGSAMGVAAEQGIEHMLGGMGHGISEANALSGAPQAGSVLGRGAKMAGKAAWGAGVTLPGAANLATMPNRANSRASGGMVQDQVGPGWRHAGAGWEHPGAGVDNDKAVARAYRRGGKVGHQHLVDRLFRAIEQAKKAEGHRTSVILQQPDETVAKALNVAQAAI